MRGFKEVIGLAVVIVGVYLLLNLFVIGSGVVYLSAHPAIAHDWYRESGRRRVASQARALFAGTGWWARFSALSMLYFPKLALGLSGFETGVAVMPLIRGDAATIRTDPRGRIRNTRKLLVTAAVIMSVYLLGSSHGDRHADSAGTTCANRGRPPNRALAYPGPRRVGRMINPLFGEVFGTIYDISTVMILGFAGAERDGRAAESGAAIFAALRHGARVGRAPFARWCLCSPPSICW